MKNYTIQFSSEPTEVEIHQFLDGLRASLMGDSSFRVHGSDTQRGTISVAEPSEEEWVESQFEATDWVVSYQGVICTDADDYILTDSVDGWSVEDGSSVFWPAKRANSPEEALVALENGEGEWRN